MRGKESRYLKPLMAKIEGLAGFDVCGSTVPAPDNTGPVYTQDTQIPTIYTPSSPQWSMRESISMLRTLSMCGTLGMPGTSGAQEDWEQRRPSGRVLEDHEMDLLQPWLQAATTQGI
jgi:hypothetical protein